jgi:hypothetical protein
MPKICYVPKNFRESTWQVIFQANDIIEEMREQGYTLTVRQLYYQFVAKALIENTKRSYDRLKSIIANARLAGHIDLDAIEDRTRFIRQNPHWSSIKQILKGCARQFRFDTWAAQSHHVEVWIEKDALVGVIENTCRDWDVGFFACRGYVSLSEVWKAVYRRWYALDKPVIVLHLGDHDPSGLDMTRDIEDRLGLFGSEHDVGIEVRRLALNMDQVQEYQPPPNFAKLSDSRAREYIRQRGPNSWELDALRPAVIVQLIEEALIDIVDMDLLEAARNRQEAAREQLTELSNRWQELFP